MKKHIVLFALAALMGSCTTYAQDTIRQRPAPLCNYFYNNWIDTTQVFVAETSYPTFSHAIAKQFVTNDDSLQVYGIAAMMADIIYLWFTPNSTYPDYQSLLKQRYPDDPSHDNCLEHLMLFQYHGSPAPTLLQLGDSLPVHILYTPVSYYFQPNNPPSGLDTSAKPVYELYFSTPQTVHDTFLVGFTHTDGGYSPIDSCWHDVRPDFGCLCFRRPGAGLGYQEKGFAFRQPAPSVSPAWEYCTFSSSYFIFPIIAPPDTTTPPNDTVINPNDTTVNPGDTIINPNDTTGVGLRQNDLIYRYTTLQPNPATDRVRVLSSFGITAIEAYDLRGRKVYEVRTPNSEFSISLDVSSWPRGTYLLRILTPAGPTTKKLLIQ